MGTAHGSGIGSGTLTRMEIDSGRRVSARGWGSWRRWLGGIGMGLWFGSLGVLAAGAAPPVPALGVYVSAAGSYAMNSSDLALDFENSLGFKARLGHRFHRFVALEAEFEWIDAFDVRIQDTTPESYGFWALTLNGRGYFTTGRFQPFVAAGLGVARARFARGDGGSAEVFLPAGSGESSFVMRLGGGLEVFTSERLALTLDASYVLPTGNLDGFDYVSIGWGFRYGF
ncbi:porin family protein [Myxococcota bacterium]|nr:porin family protein [Myxococcota bacterium]